VALVTGDFLADQFLAQVALSLELTGFRVLNVVSLAKPKQAASTPN
jgi:hypothetical protein